MAAFSPPWALGARASGPCGPDVAGRWVSGGPQGSARYAALADDSSAEARKREASLLLCAAERHLVEEDVSETLASAMSALQLFRESGDACGVHDSLRLVLQAQRLESALRSERPLEAELLASQELKAFQAQGDRRGEAAMRLSLAECLSDRRAARLSELCEAEAWAQRALELFLEERDERMAAASLLELAHLHALRGEAEGLAEKAARARELFGRIGDGAGEARALHGAAIAEVLERRLPEAVAKMREASAAFGALGLRRHQAFESCVIAEVLLEDEKPSKALPVAREALSLFREISYGKGWEAASLCSVVRSLVGKQQADLAVRAAQEGLSRFLGESDRRQHIHGYQILSEALLADGRPAEALDACHRAQDVAAEIEDRRTELGVMHSAMWVHLHLGELDRAVDRMDDAANLAEDLEDEAEEALAAQNLAFLCLQRGEHRQVAEHARQAGALFEKLEHKAGEAAALMLAAAGLSDQDRVADAIGKCVQAQDLYRSARDLRGEFEACAALAELHLAREDVESALQVAERGAEVARAYRSRSLEATAWRLLARVQLDAGRPEASEKSALRAREAASAAQDRAGMTQAQLQLTQALLATEGHVERAMRSATEAVALSGRCNDRGLVAITRFVRAQLLNGAGRAEEARRGAEEALRWFRKAGDGLGEARTLVLLGHALLALDRKEEAKRLAEEAQSLAGGLGQAEAEASELLERVSAKERAPVAPVAVAPGPAQETEAPVASVAKPEPTGLDPTTVRRKLLEMTRNLMSGDDELENDSPFMEAGLDSLSSVQLMSELGKEFQMAMSPSLVFDFPTINALADYLVEESKSTSSY